jgi:sugar/nucleoside kinase (ribokinase family)
MTVRAQLLPMLKPGMVDWDAILEGVSWFHFSAICPALSQQAADVCLRFCRQQAVKILLFRSI